jgi:hypothetical protein
LFLAGAALFGCSPAAQPGRPGGAVETTEPDVAVAHQVVLQVSDMT